MRERSTKRLQLMFEGKSRAKQSFRDECDINNIMSKFQKTGVLTHVKQHAGTYADVSHLISYQDSLSVVMQAQAMFMQLPAKVRAEFSNDPQAFLTFVSDPANVPELIKMGIAKEVKMAPPGLEVPPKAEPPKPGANNEPPKPATG